MRVDWDGVGFGSFAPGAEPENVRLALELDDSAKALVLFGLDGSHQVGVSKKMVWQAKRHACRSQVCFNLVGDLLCYSGANEVRRVWVKIKPPGPQVLVFGSIYQGSM